MLTVVNESIVFVLICNRGGKFRIFANLTWKSQLHFRHYIDINVFASVKLTFKHIFLHYILNYIHVVFFIIFLCLFVDFKLYLMQRNWVYIIGNCLALRSIVKTFRIIGYVEEILNLLDFWFTFFNRLNWLERYANVFELGAVHQISSCKLDVTRSFISFIVYRQPSHQGFLGFYVDEGLIRLHYFNCMLLFWYSDWF